MQDKDLLHAGRSVICCGSSGGWDSLQLQQNLASPNQHCMAIHLVCANMSDQELLLCCNCKMSKRLCLHVPARYWLRWVWNLDKVGGNYMHMITSGKTISPPLFMMVHQGRTGGSHFTKQWPSLTQYKPQHLSKSRAQAANNGSWLHSLTRWKRAIMRVGLTWKIPQLHIAYGTEMRPPFAPQPHLASCYANAMLNHFMRLAKAQAENT